MSDPSVKKNQVCWVSKATEVGRFLRSSDSESGRGEGFRELVSLARWKIALRKGDGEVPRLGGGISLLIR